MYIDGYFIEWPLGRNYPLEVRKKARLIAKAEKLLKKAAKTRGFFEAVGGCIHGNVNTADEKYEKLLKACDRETMYAIGAGTQFGIVSYVDGSYSIQLAEARHG